MAFCAVKILIQGLHVIGYVGNRLNVLFYLAGSFFLSSKRDYCIICKICVTAKTV